MTDPVIDVAALYAEHERSVWRYVSRRLGNATAAELDDVAASVWARAWTKRRQYQDRGLPPMAWVYRIAHSTIVDYARRRARRPVPMTFESLDHTPTVEDRDPMQYADLYAAVDRLTGKQRITVESFHFEGRSIRETARMIGTSEESVKKFLERARVKMRVMLEGAA